MKFGDFRRNVGQGFFAVLTDDVDESLRVLRTVLSPENECAEVRRFRLKIRRIVTNCREFRPILGNF